MSTCKKKAIVATELANTHKYQYTDKRLLLQQNLATPTNTNIPTKGYCCNKLANTHKYQYTNNRLLLQQNPTIKSQNPNQCQHTGLHQSTQHTWNVSGGLWALIVPPRLHNVVGSLFTWSRRSHLKNSLPGNGQIHPKSRHVRLVGENPTRSGPPVQACEGLRSYDYGLAWNEHSPPTPLSLDSSMAKIQQT